MLLGEKKIEYYSDIEPKVNLKIAEKQTETERMFSQDFQSLHNQLHSQTQKITWGFISLFIALLGFLFPLILQQNGQIKQELTSHIERVNNALRSDIKDVALRVERTIEVNSIDDKTKGHISSPDIGVETNVKNIKKVIQESYNQQNVPDL